MGKLIKIKFKRDYSPRKKGEVVELEEKLANYYLSISVAEIPCTDCEDKPCTECEKLIQADLEAKAVNENINEIDNDLYDKVKENKQTKTKKK